MWYYVVSSCSLQLACDKKYGLTWLKIARCLTHVHQIQANSGERTSNSHVFGSVGVICQDFDGILGAADRYRCRSVMF